MSRAEFDYYEYDESRVPRIPVKLKGEAGQPRQEKEPGWRKGNAGVIAGVWSRPAVPSEGGWAPLPVAAVSGSITASGIGW